MDLTTEQPPSPPIPMNYFISVSILIVSGLALLFNAVSIPLALRKPFIDSVFGVFLLFKSSHCVIIAFIFVFWSFPLSIAPSLYDFCPKELKITIGILLITADGTATFFTFMVSVNRFVVLWNIRSRKEARNIPEAWLLSICVTLAGVGVSTFIHLRGDALYPTYSNLWFDWSTGKRTPIGDYKIYYFYILRTVSLLLDIVAFVKLKCILSRMLVNQNFSFDVYFFYLITLQHVAAFANTVFYTKWFNFPWMTTEINFVLRYGMWQFCYLLDGLSCLMMSKFLRLKMRQISHKILGIHPKAIVVTPLASRLPS